MDGCEVGISRQALDETLDEIENLQALIAELEAREAVLVDALEAADSMVKSYEEGDLGGWEVALYKRRRDAIDPRTKDKLEGGE